MATAIPENRATFTAWEIAAVTDGDLTRLPDDAAVASGLVTDSRSVVPRNGFIALKGQSFDGHEFLPTAIAAGAAVVVVERGRPVPDASVAVIEVDDALVAFGRLAAAHVRRWRRADTRRRVAALTGSAGKTTTKELAVAILSSVGTCHGTKGNLNNRIGVPTVALGLEDETYAVFELGMSVPGEIATLAGIVLPDVSALLNVGVAHAEGFGGSRAAIAREKGSIFDSLTTSGTAIANADDAAAHAQLARAGGRHVRVGRASTAAVRLVAREPVLPGGSRVTVNREGETFDVFLPVVGEAAAHDLLVAIALADATAGFAISHRTIANAVRAWQPPAGRSSALSLVGGIYAIDDSYNANPASMRAALATLAELRDAGNGRAVAVLGEMRELGPISLSEHEALGRELVRRRIDLVIGCGGSMDAALRGAEAAGVEVLYARDADTAGALVADRARSGDVILFKGSRGVTVERALAALVARYPVIADDRRGSP